MDLAFTAADEQFREEVRTWLEESLKGDFAELRGRGGPGDEEECFDGLLAWEQHRAKSGWLGIAWPKEHGGRGSSLMQQVIFNEEYARARAPGRLSHIGEELTGPTILAFGTEEQKQRYLPKMAAGQLIGCFGLTEADFGSNPGGMLTKAVRDGDHFVLNGSKYWITNGSVADVAIVWAKLDGVVRGFLVKNKFSLRASDTSELVLEDVRIHKSQMLPGVEGLKGPLNCLTQARYGIAFGAVGAAQAAFDEACRYSQMRIMFDKPIARFQLVQNKLVWMANEITKAQLMCWKLGKMKEAGAMQHFHVSMAKRNSCWMALECCRLGRDILGANGITDEYQMMRHMCNLESVITYEGTHDIHTLIIGRQLTGCDAIM
jgi:glutaryl-CoA dehydrogenase